MGKISQSQFKLKLEEIISSNNYHDCVAVRINSSMNHVTVYNYIENMVIARIDATEIKPLNKYPLYEGLCIKIQEQFREEVKLASTFPENDMHEYLIDTYLENHQKGKRTSSR